MIGRVSSAAADANLVPALRAVHAEPGAWARQAVAQLIAVAEHVRDRPADPLPARRTALETALDELRGTDLVPSDGSPWERASVALTACVGRDDPDADRVRAALRPVLVAELDDELAATSPMLEGFRGRVRDA